MAFRSTLFLCFDRVFETIVPRVFSKAISYPPKYRLSIFMLELYKIESSDVDIYIYKFVSKQYSI